MAAIVLDRERQIGYSWAAIKRLKKEHGINFLTLVSGGTEWYLEPDIFSAVLWCGLVDNDTALTVDQVDGMVTLPKLTAITGAMLEAVGEALQGGEQNANPPTRSTGSSG